MNSNETAQTQGSFTFFRFLLCLVLIAFAAFAARNYTLPRLGGWLNVGEDPKYSDFVLVLNGDRESRPFAAADLYRQARVGSILILASPDSERHTGRREHEKIRAILTRCGVPDTDIQLLDHQSGSTFDEASTLKEFVKHHPDASVSVLTSDYHTRRTRWVFSRVLGEETSGVRFVSAKTGDFSSSNWWKHEDGFVWYISEFFKFSFYVVRYGHGLAYIGVTVGLVAVGWWLRKRTVMQASTV